MKFVLLALVAFATLPVQAANLSKFSDAKSAFENARAPQAKELYNALWMATSIASNPKIRGALSGRFPNGRLPAGNGEFVRQIAHISVNANGSAEAKIVTTDAEIGVLIEEIRHQGSLSAKGLKLEASGDSQTCATQSLCRTLQDKTLLCAQINNDSRKECTRSYKQGSISSYLGYTPVHP